MSMIRLGRSNAELYEVFGCRGRFHSTKRKTMVHRYGNLPLFDNNFLSEVVRKEDLLFNFIFLVQDLLQIKLFKVRE